MAKKWTPRDPDIPRKEHVERCKTLEAENARLKAAADRASDIQRLLNDTADARNLLEQALEKSQQLVASLEAAVALQRQRADSNFVYWQDENLLVKELREKLSKVQSEPALIDQLTMERNSFQRQLDKCLGWIAKADGKGPFDAPEPDAGYPFYNGSR